MKSLALQITLIPMEISAKGYVEMEGFSWKNAYEIENAEKEEIIVWQDNRIRCAASLQNTYDKAMAISAVWDGIIHFPASCSEEWITFQMSVFTWTHNAYYRVRK